MIMAMIIWVQCKASVDKHYQISTSNDGFQNILFGVRVRVRVRAEFMVKVVAEVRISPQDNARYFNDSPTTD